MNFLFSVCFALREKCPNTEFFLVRIQENTDQTNSVFGHFSRSVGAPKSTVDTCHMCQLADSK